MGERKRTFAHWGAYDLTVADGRIEAVEPWALDPDPSPLGRSFASVAERRVPAPLVREGWLDHRLAEHPRRRGADRFLAVTWDEALDLVAGELARVRTTHGNRAIYGGSYGWASAGRFHHAQSQIHRFLAAIGGYTASRNTYSLAAAEVIIPHVLGHSFDDIQDASTSLQVIARDTRLLVSFGGLPVKNSQIQSGGQGRHVVAPLLREARANGCRFVSISPLRDDTMAELGAEWLAIRPNTDTAVMLALAHTLVVEGLADLGFLDRYTVGFDRWRAYLLGESDGTPKTAEWAAAISGLAADRIRALARDLAATRSMLNAAWSLQRADHGEQPFWAIVALAAVVGQIGLPGGGFALGYAAVGSVGNGGRRVRAPRFPGILNKVATFIPVARIAEMLERPGESYDYDGQRLTYPDIRLVYWAGGNPFHHHQDLNRLVAAWQRPETIVVHDPFFTAAAAHADIVLPITTPLERRDFGGASVDPFLVSMDPAIPPVAEARDDYAVFSALADRLGAGPRFHQHRTAEDWQRHLYAKWQERHQHLPDYDSFLAAGHVEHRDTTEGESWLVLLADFRADPSAYPLPTPSGRIEICSDTIAGFGYSDCPPHPAWIAPREWLGAEEARRFPLHLISNQPAHRLHSQWDAGEAALFWRHPLRRG